MIGNVNVPGALAADIANKVDKISGKGLSTEDYTTAEKTKLAELKNYTGGTGITIDNDGTINCTADITTIDDDFSTISENPVQNKVINNALSNKVDKVSGKGLSTNDFTNADKNAISQFSGLVIDYGRKELNFSSFSSHKSISFNKTFNLPPAVFCFPCGTRSYDTNYSNNQQAFCRIFSVTTTKFDIESYNASGIQFTSGTLYYMWFAIGT